MLYKQWAVRSGSYIVSAGFAAHNTTQASAEACKAYCAARAWCQAVGWHAGSRACVPSPATLATRTIRDERKLERGWWLYELTFWEDVSGWQLAAPAGSHYARHHVITSSPRHCKRSCMLRDDCLVAEYEQLALAHAPDAHNCVLVNINVQMSNLPALYNVSAAVMHHHRAFFAVYKHKRIYSYEWDAWSTDTFADTSLDFCRLYCHRDAKCLLLEFEVKLTSVRGYRQYGETNPFGNCKLFKHKDATEVRAEEAGSLSQRVFTQHGANTHVWEKLHGGVQIPERPEIDVASRPYPKPADIA